MNSCKSSLLKKNKVDNRKDAGLKEKEKGKVQRFEIGHSKDTGTTHNSTNILKHDSFVSEMGRKLMNKLPRKESLDRDKIKKTNHTLTQ